MSKLERELTVLVDYKKYMQENGLRLSRQYSDYGSNNGNYSLKSPNRSGCNDDDDNSPCHQQEYTPFNVCHDTENEVFQECGSKCVLGCRYAAASTSSVTIGKHECDKNDCVEGCFCKTGLVRHQNKCIPVLECPIRKCHHRDEVYVSHLVAFTFEN